jgi:hypothetical protein
MNLQDRFRQHKPLLDTLVTGTQRTESLGFADLMGWTQNEYDEWLERVSSHRNPGVQFTSSCRTFVLEEHRGQLRFYAGGWHDSVYDEPNELGVFPSVEEALTYAVAFLIAGQHPTEISAQRKGSISSP